MAEPVHRTVLAAAVGAIVFVLLVPGTALVLVPYLLTGWRLGPPLLGWSATRWLGAALLVLALPIWVMFNLRFVVEGRGTPAPLAPPERLAVGGPFRWVRNPGYVSVVALLVGQALLFASPALLAYAAVVALGFHLFVILYEEPTLRRQFGVEYETYCRAVPRWIPRLRPAPRQRASAT
jgi:protein-S-isoprenylcysteine O-methyltransferase Ste14